MTGLEPVGFSERPLLCAVSQKVSNKDLTKALNSSALGLATSHATEDGDLKSRPDRTQLCNGCCVAHSNICYKNRFHHSSPSPYNKCDGDRNIEIEQNSISLCCSNITECLRRVFSACLQTRFSNYRFARTIQYLHVRVDKIFSS